MKRKSRFWEGTKLLAGIALIVLAAVIGLACLALMLETVGVSLIGFVPAAIFGIPGYFLLTGVDLTVVFRK